MCPQDPVEETGSGEGRDEILFCVTMPGKGRIERSNDLFGELTRALRFLLELSI